MDTNVSPMNLWCDETQSDITVSPSMLNEADLDNEQVLEVDVSMVEVVDTPTDEPDEIFVLKNDQMRIKSAIQDILKANKVPKVVCQAKNSADSVKTMELGDKYAAGHADTDVIIMTYTKAIAQAPCDSMELALAYDKRSIVLFQARFYEDCLSDITRALSSNCPDNIKAELYARCAQCLLVIDGAVTSEVKRAITESLRWFEPLGYAKKQSVLHTLLAIKPQYLLSPHVKWNDSLFLPKTPKDNSKILNTSGAIKLQYSKKFGRHVVATRDIKAGEALIVHRAYATAFSLHDNPFIAYEYCWNCCKRVWCAIPCPSCVNVVYCDESCRDAAWNEHHEIECSVISAILNGLKSDDTQLMSLRVSVKALKEAWSWIGLITKLENIDAIKDPIAKFFDGNVYDNTKYASVYSLEKLSNKESNAQNHPFNSACILYYLAMTTDIFGKKLSSFDEILSNKWAMFMGALILRNADIIYENTCEQQVNQDEREQSVSRGDALVPFSQFFNHSCETMVFQYSVTGDITTITALRRIKEGEQIFLNYEPTWSTEPTSKRRELIKNSYNFVCNCVACKNNWSTESSYPRCDVAHFSRDVKKQLARIKINTTKYIKGVCNNSDDKEVAEAITDLENMLNVYGRHVEDPCQEVTILKNLLISRLLSVPH